MKYRIILTGAQGTGKTTLNNILHEFLPDYKVIDSMSAQFFTKELLKNINSPEYMKAQNDIYDFAEAQYLEDVPYISSRGFADSYAYLNHSKGKSACGVYDELLKRNFMNQKKLLRASENRVYHFYTPIEFEIESKELRSSNKVFQKEIDESIVEFLNGTKTPYTTLSGTPKQRVSQVLRTLGLE